MHFNQEFKNKISIVDEYLDKYLSEQNNYQSNIYKAMRYSLFAGGKRLRPVITMACCEIVGGDILDALPFACAIEMIHTYSLIHDDLPAMDNDDFRRGKLTNHKVFGEAMAILAGDGLLNKAFEIAVDESFHKGIDANKVLRAVSSIANASGTEGMIGGQVVDLEAENSNIDIRQLEYMHLHKTGALIIAAAKAGAIIGGASEEEIDSLGLYGRNLGLAFQIKDDILDVEGSKEKLGKSIGSDENNGKSTFVTLVGIEKSKQLVNELTQNAMAALERFGDRKWFLGELARYLIDRDY